MTTLNTHFQVLLHLHLHVLLQVYQIHSLTTELFPISRIHSLTTELFPILRDPTPRNPLNVNLPGHNEIGISTFFVMRRIDQENVRSIFFKFIINNSTASALAV